MSDLSQMHDLVVKAVEQKWVLGQALDKYTPAQELVRAGMNWG